MGLEKKRIAGNKGSTRLTRQGGKTLKDDEAETRLSELLKAETASGGGAANRSAFGAGESRLESLPG